MGLRIEVLGPLRVRARRQITVERSSHRRLLAILAIDANRRLSTDVLIDRYWGDAVPTTAKAALQTHISALRKLLPADVILTEGYGYRLDLGEHSLDVHEFVALAAEARQATRARRWEAALESVDAAVELRRGDPYDELRDDDFARSEISRLEEIRLELEEMRAEALLGMGSNQEALAGLEPLVRAHPLRERLWEQLMLARYRLGRHPEALAAYREAWAVFAELGLEPGASLRRLEQKILLHDESVRQAKTPHNLPVELTRFIGRDTELGEVAGLLDEHRMVTLTGVGGSGKTRLAFRVAAGQLSAFPDGCWVAELGPLHDPDHVALGVASAMGLRPQGEDVVDALRAALVQERILVVLDNCEHLLHASAALARTLLEAAPNVHILATSREPLRVPGEALYDVPPLPVPPEEGDAVHVELFDAVQLFGDRASQARPRFALDDSNADAVATICRRLDGIPLAIELAASRVASLAPQTIAERLGERFLLLTGGSTTGPERHRTLEAALAWSYDLLDAREKLVFARLSIFRGGFTHDTAEEVCSGEGIEPAVVVPLVSSLVEKSLVSVYDAQTGERYRLLETLREFAGERLEETGRAEVIAARHLDWCVRFAEDIVDRVHGPGRQELFERVRAESDNLDAALQQARAAESSGAVRVLARTLGEHWNELGYVDLSIALYEAALERTSTVDAATEAEIRALLGRAHFEASDGRAAYAEAERAHALIAGLEPSPVKLYVLSAYAGLHRILLDRDPGGAIPLGEDALACAEALGHPFYRIRALMCLGEALAWNGALEPALERHREALSLALSTGDPRVVMETYEHLATALYLDPNARRRGPASAAEDMLARIPLEERGRELSDGWLPWVFLQTGDWRRAELVIDRIGRAHLEAWERTSYHVERAALRWMQGRLEEACAELDELERHGVNPRWYHDYFPLVADVAADLGCLSDVRQAAEEYLVFDVDTSEQAKKLGVIEPLVRAEVDAALAASGRGRAEHVRRARAAVARGHEILNAFPPPSEGSVQMETHRTHLAFAEAELSRVDGPNPGLWLVAVDRADYVYFRLYARFRLAEALLAVGRENEGADELRAAHADATTVGAERIRRQLEQLATEVGAKLTKRPRARARS